MFPASIATYQEEGKIMLDLEMNNEKIMNIGKHEN